MITLYVKTGCPYCAMVIAKLNELEVPFEEKNIADEEVAKELLAKGGKRQVPYIDDEEPCENAKHHTPCIVDGDVEMYESADIVEYLDKNYELKQGETA